MVTKKRLITSYYAVIICFLAFQAIMTVYQGGQIIGHGKTLTQLEREKAALAEQTYSLKQTLATNSSLLHIASSPVYNQFQPMSGVLKIEHHQTVASR